MDLTVKVVPRSSRNQIVGPMPDGALKVRIAAPPEKSKANAELCRFLAETYAVPLKNVAILSGHASPLKRVRILR